MSLTCRATTSLRSAYTCVSGNNVIAFQDIQSHPTVQSGANLQFLYTQDPTQDPTASANLDAARVNTFYVINSVHDYAYRYGFTESAFNFQTDNFGKGGEGNDRITASVQVSPGTDNAFFATMRDGINGQMRLYIWDFTDPRRDGALENDIVVHEVRHMQRGEYRILSSQSIEHSRDNQPHDGRGHCSVSTDPRGWWSR